MQKKLLKKVGVIFMAISMFSLLGCGEIDKKQADQTVSLLEEKYNEKFVATHIGERYGTKTNDTVTTVIHPEGNENLTFQAIMTKDGELVGDGYIPRLISEQFNNILKEELESQGLEIEAFTLAMGANSNGETNSSITIGEYVEKYQPKFFSAQAIIKDTGDVTGEQLEQALKAAYETGTETTYQIQARVIPEDEYEKAREEFIKLSEVSSSWFRDYNVVEKIDAVADSNGYHFQYSGGHSAIEDGE